MGNWSALSSSKCNKSRAKYAAQMMLDKWRLSWGLIYWAGRSRVWEVKISEMCTKLCWMKFGTLIALANSLRNFNCFFWTSHGKIFLRPLNKQFSLNFLPCVITIMRLHLTFKILHRQTQQIDFWSKKPIKTVSPLRTFDLWPTYIQRNFNVISPVAALYPTSTGNSWRLAHREKSAAAVQSSKMHEKWMDSSVAQPERIFLDMHM